MTLKCTEVDWKWKKKKKKERKIKFEIKIWQNTTRQFSFEANGYIKSLIHGLKV